MKQFQDKVKKFNDIRGWTNEVEVKGMKDFLLNMCEEVGEAWSVIKWVDNDKLKELIEKYKDSYEDFVGDQLFLILKIANIAGIDSEKAIERTLEDYKRRFPISEVKEKKHGNVLAGGVDNK